MLQICRSGGLSPCCLQSWCCNFKPCPWRAGDEEFLEEEPECCNLQFILNFWVGLWHFPWLKSLGVSKPRFHPPFSFLQQLDWAFPTLLGLVFNDIHPRIISVPIHAGSIWYLLDSFGIWSSGQSSEAAPSDLSLGFSLSPSSWHRSFYHPNRAQKSRNIILKRS